MKLKNLRVLALTISAIAAIAICSTVISFGYALVAYPNSFATTNPHYLPLEVANHNLYTFILCSIITALTSSPIAYKLVKTHNKRRAAKKRG